MPLDEPNYIAGRFAERCREYLIQALEARGHAGAIEHVVGDRTATLSWTAYQTMLERANHPELCEGIGLFVGQALTFNDYGVLGYASLTKRTFGESIEATAPFTRLLGWPVTVSLAHVSGGAYRVQLEANVHRPLTRALQEQWLAMCAHGAVNKISDARISNIRIAITCSKPRHYEPYRACFGDAQVHFDAPACSWTYPEAWHGLPLKTFDSELGAICQSKLASMAQLAPTAQPEAERVQAFLLTNIVDGFPTMIDVADHFGISVITLRRRLKESGTTFQQIVIDLKKDIAARLLLNPRAKSQEIAYRLGYETPANFHTAFKQWFGCTVKEFRARLAE